MSVKNRAPKVQGSNNDDALLEDLVSGETRRGVFAKMRKDPESEVDEKTFLWMLHSSPISSLMVSFMDFFASLKQRKTK